MLAKDKDVIKLAESLRGHVLLPSDGEAYKAALHVWNLDTPRMEPQILVQVRGASDVIAALSFARARGLNVSVAGGRHQFTGRALSGDLVVDMRLMRSVHVNAAEKYAWADGGCIIEDLDRESIVYGLAAVGGQYYDTGVAGFTLGGGMGHLSSKHGLSCDNLLAVEIVTADGTVHIVDKASDPDLFFALRGAGWHYGVVLRFKLKLHTIESFPGMVPEAPIVHGAGGIVFWPAQHAEGLFRRFRKLHAKKEVPREASVVLAAATTPDGPMVALQYVWIGHPDRGLSWLAQWLDVAEPALNTVKALHFLQLQHVHDPLLPPHLRYYITTRYSNDEAFFADGGSGTPPFEATVAQLAALDNVPPGLNAFFAFAAPGYAVEEYKEPTAYSARSSRVAVMAGVSAPPGLEVDMEAGRRYIRDCVDKGLGKYSVKQFYANISSEVDDPSLTGSCGYQSADLAKLQHVKARVDPDNLFKTFKMA